MPNHWKFTKVNNEKKLRSHTHLYLLFKYMFLNVAILICVGLLKFETLSTKNLLGFGTTSLICLILYVVISRYLFSARVDDSGIWLTKTKHFQWNEIASIKRINHVYHLKSKSNEHFFFPIDFSPSILIGFSVDDSAMDRMIKRMMRQSQRVQDEHSTGEAI